MKRIWLRLVLVACIFGGFAAALVFILDKPEGRGRWQHAQTEMGEIRKALIMYRIEHKRYPETLDALTETYFRGGVPKDPYSKADYHYITNGEAFVLICYGRDGAPGGESEPDFDIVFTEEGHLVGR